LEELREVAASVRVGRKADAELRRLYLTGVQLVARSELDPELGLAEVLWPHEELAAVLAGTPADWKPRAGDCR
jgi:hypothetical protein